MPDALLLSSSSMSSLCRVFSFRANGRSLGPVTPAGKQQSSQHDESDLPPLDRLTTAFQWLATSARLPLLHRYETRLHISCTRCTKRTQSQVRTPGSAISPARPVTTLSEV